MSPSSPDSVRPDAPSLRDDGRRRPRRSLVLGVLLLLLLGSPATASAASRSSPTGDTLVGTTFEEARRTGEGRIVVAFFDASPFSSLDADGRPRGVELEMLHLFARQMEEDHGIELEVDWRPFDSFRRILDEVARGRGGVFGVSQISATPQRRERLDFSRPYMQAVGVLVTHADEPVFTSEERMIQRLKGRKAVTVPETTLETYVKELRKGPLPDLEILRVEAAQGMTRAIQADPEGTFAYLDYTQFGFALKAGAPLRRHPIGDRRADPLAVAMPPGSDWAPLLNRFLDPETGFPSELAYDLLVRRYLGGEMLGAIRP